MPPKSFTTLLALAISCAGLVFYVVKPNLIQKTDRRTSDRDVASDSTPPVYKPVIFSEDDIQTPEKLLGERLFRDTRFTKFFFKNFGGHYNRVPKSTDHVSDVLRTFDGKLGHPYHGQSIACASCHLVDQLSETAGGGFRSYTDFSRRSALTNADGKPGETNRNSISLVGSARLFSDHLHFDGEFESTNQLIVSTFFGSDFGWESGDAKLALHHFAEVLRNDDGSYPTDALLNGMSYQELFQPTQRLQENLKIDASLRLNLKAASDEKILSTATEVLKKYLLEIDFTRDENGLYLGSPFDLFLFRNRLPKRPENNESDIAYTIRLMKLISAKKDWKWITSADGQFLTHNQEFEFGEKEMRGLRAFVGQGQCVQCHAAPDFTDRFYHNTGISQLEYDSVFGAKSFQQLKIPSEPLDKPGMPNPFASIPQKDQPNFSDLGVWNSFAFTSKPHPKLRKLFCDHSECANTSHQWMSLAIARFRTPTLRNLGQSAPYFHNGSASTLMKAIEHYAHLKPQEIRNGDKKLQAIHLTKNDISDLEAFLKSLNEDYK